MTRYVPDCRDVYLRDRDNHIHRLERERNEMLAAVRAFLDAHDAGRSVREEMAALRSQLGSD